MKIGIDFGSTYSTFSSYDCTAEPQLKALILEEGRAPAIPSVVSLSRKGDFTYGNAAKDVVGNRNQRVFEAFKMLLVEADPDVLRARGYDSEYSPQRIAKFFLNSVIERLEDRYHEEIGDVVICVPEIWGKKINKTLDGRGTLQDILTTDKADRHVNRRVRVVTEPEAASAFFAYNYEKKTKEAFNGHLLLIDYGGGTLDLTLTRVSSDGKGSMEISYCAGGGAGENHVDEEGNSTIGNAGIAFMQDVVRRAMLEQEYIRSDEEVPYTSPAFLKAVKELESMMINKAAEIQRTFGRLGTYRNMGKLLQKERMHFTELDYGDNGLEITYQQILRSYQSAIETVLCREIAAINVEVKRAIGANPCTPEAGVAGNFKIALVGGFGSFFLVQHQIADIYSLDADVESDLRLKNIDDDKKETAISLGAALIASDRVVLKRVSRYSIGIAASKPDGSCVPYYGINCNQIVEPGKIYYICKDGSQTPAVYGNIRGTISTFVINFSGKPKQGVQMRLKPRMFEALSQGLEEHGLWTCGFSMDESNIITFHAIPYQPKGQLDTRKPAQIPLARFTDLFETTVFDGDEFI